MAIVHVIRFSNNPQIKSFGDTHLPERFTAKDPDTGLVREFTFKNAYGAVQGFTIANGGTEVIDTEKDYNEHNYQSLRALVANPRMIPPGSEFRLVNLESEAEAQKANRALRMKALNMIESSKDNGGLIGSIARRLGINNVGSLSAGELLNRVEERAEAEPQTVISIMQNAYQPELFEFDKAKESGLIRNKNGFYYYGEIQLGLSEAEVVAYFLKDQNLYSEIVRRNQSSYGPSAVRLADSLRSQAASAWHNEQGSAQPLIATDVQKNSAAKTETPAKGEETQADPEAVKLFEDAKAAGVLVFEQSDDYGDFYQFGVASMLDGTGADAETQAINFLSHPANKGIAKAMRKAIGQKTTVEAI
ncbi:hypothetical protein CLV58_12584 [Spirosoma oryzae]|uniref:Uncharacterized protein n=1 Tax=Spirosoma oryzae TaxID=1469603 RepID=A0A2T0S8U2_9BACT|nr:hypothetical protein [Spirosoma oryzae]PRY29822.1 hypothetical protein CLV58_12584 [Spirosoma oryzae]